ncbi:HAD superfamily hydrolase [Mycolicibacterium mageritense DSM 44476 = CIP 104973]|uniref:Sugar-phosphatase n=1 Tax=Mycolicibacterium mageritense TaxID=53462 RepID=A0ABM7I5F4_MYCME|nr:HAD-IIA family hydrolase [Mycolicibacterium mageritense]MCC9185311.1 HAD-IIA family hydrolase [Mycolicibacterium mageritense]BBX38140.1 sugar-phosphatase [Mycolicibacterium mageritense]CDO27125.1 putative HAD superfamily sugar phosphatase [Mycolicibacterium mageritense DSM 44476 = CIP 104973]
MTARLIDNFDGVLADLDGVVYRGPRAIDGATDALGKLVGEGKSLAYVTNNASRSCAEVAAHLRELGAPATADQVFGSALAGAELLAREVASGSAVLVVGSQILADSVRAQGLVVVSAWDDQPDAVIQGFSPALGWKDLAAAAYAITAGATWVATNMDMTLPQERGLAPGNGTLVAAVAAATGKWPLVAGKPEAALFETAARHSGVERALVVGDRLDTDILGGNRAGMETALVLTGVDSPQTALTARVDERPRYLIRSLGQLYEEYPSITADGEAYSCGAAVARVSGTNVHIRGRDDDLDSWRAACAAWWAAHPATAPDGAPHILFTTE